MRPLFLLAVGLASGCLYADDTDEPGHIYTIYAPREEELESFVPGDVSVDPSTGTLYAADWQQRRLIARDSEGRVRVIAGAGDIGVVTDGPALAAPIGVMGDVLADGAGGLYVSGFSASALLQIDLASGELHRIAGAGHRAYGGDGGPATTAEISTPGALALLPDHRLLFADGGNQVLRTLDVTNGVVDHFAGVCVVDWQGSCATPVACPGSEKLVCAPATCSYPCSPAPGPDVATRDDVRFGFTYGAQAFPSKLVVDGDGRVIVADTVNHRVRAIDPDGYVETLADGLENPTDVAISPDGTLYITDFNESCIFQLEPGGTLSTFAGTCGVRGFAGDGGAASQAQLNRPIALALDVKARRLYIADADNNRIRYVAL